MEDKTETRELLTFKNVKKTKTLVRFNLEQYHFGFDFANGNSFRADNGVIILSKGNKISWNRKSNTLFVPDSPINYLQSSTGQISVGKANFEKISYAVDRYNSWRKKSVHSVNVTSDDLKKYDEINSDKVEVFSDVVREHQDASAVAAYFDKVISEKNGVILSKQLEVESIISEITSLRKEVKSLEEANKDTVISCLEEELLDPDPDSGLDELYD